MGKHELATQSSWRPTAKVLATWVTGAGATACLGVITAVSSSIPAETFWGGLAVYVLAGAAGWIKKSRRTDVGA